MTPVGSEGLALYDPVSHYALVNEAGFHPHVSMPVFLGITLFSLGYPDQASAQSAAAIAVARLKALRFAAEDPKGGGVVHGPRIFAQPTCHHRPDVLGGIGEQESAELLRRFFAERR